MYKRQVIDIAKKKQKKYIWLGVWNENTNAIAFYKKMGFVIFDRHTFTIGKDVQEDYLMRLEIE